MLCVRIVRRRGAKAQLLTYKHTKPREALPFPCFSTSVVATTLGNFSCIYMTFVRCSSLGPLARPADEQDEVGELEED